MELDVKIDNDSLLIPINNPFSLDLEITVKQIEGFASSKGIELHDLNIKGLIPKMIRGIAGCEQGCPSDAKSLTTRGFKGFDLEYVEGGILTAKAEPVNGRTLYLKMFPDF
ncbi:MAG: hypothetical protein HY754_03010 [Nitrospirae bacterium]|nr:hypothetical protein [Nitrospirota bacterium]